MGGAPSLAADIDVVDAEIFISANGHGIPPFHADYLVALDPIEQHTGQPLEKWLRARSPAPIISPRDYADIRIESWALGQWWPQCGLVAIWAAQEMGAACIHLAGFDCYGGQRHVIEQAQELAPHITCPVIVASGPLREVWPLE